MLTHDSTSGVTSTTVDESQRFGCIGHVCDMLPVYNCPINVKDSLGEIPTSPLKWCDVYKN